MNDIETRKALSLLQECYPHFMDGRNFDATRAIWSNMFPSEEYQRVEAAIMAFVASDVKGYPPAIGQIKEKLAQMEAQTEVDEAGAWALVAKAMRNGIYGSEKEFAKLPYEVQRCVGSPEQLHDWAMMDVETVNSVVSSNFMRSYRARAGHMREMKKLPDTVRSMYLAAGDAFAFDRALPAPKKQHEPEPEPVACPDSVKNVRDAMRKKADADKVDDAKRKVAELMNRFGIPRAGDSDG